MKKAYNKLVALSLLLVMALAVVTMSSYAWFTMSGNPVVSGIQINIGGSNTIKVASDVQIVSGEAVCHYPGVFRGSLNLTEGSRYDYLEQLYGLTPVSTADGRSWLIPEYYSSTDAAVKNGTAVTGQLKPFGEFIRDTELGFANLTDSDADKALKGSYAYVDFWVVSPADNCNLRISTGSGDSGSFVVNLMEVVETVDGSYVLEPADSGIASSVRIGFLVNEDVVLDESMVEYVSSDYYSSNYKYLQGRYQEPGDAASTAENYAFTIYEPNGNVHMDGSEDYLITKPLAVVDGSIRATDVSGRLVVQKESCWSEALTGEGTYLQQMFQAYIAGKTFEKGSAEVLEKGFYGGYLQYLLASYVDKGEFIKSTGSLFGLATDDKVPKDNLSMLAEAGATDDMVIATLERDIPQRIRMFIWLEGQDADCINEIATSKFIINIELAGSKQ